MASLFKTKSEPWIVIMKTFRIRYLTVSVIHVFDILAASFLHIVTYVLCAFVAVHFCT